MKKKIKNKSLVFVAGGSGGPVTPLLAVADILSRTHRQLDMVFVGTRTGPEKELVLNAGFSFFVVTSGKWRRYFSLKNIYAPVLSGIGFFQALVLLRNIKPSVVIGSGSFVQVPLLWAAWFLSIPIVIHQQDARVSLANILCAPIAKKITVSLQSSLSDFAHAWTIGQLAKSSRVIWTGNPVRQNVLAGEKSAALKLFGFTERLPVVLVMGGGTGALAINQLVLQALPELTSHMQILHITGKGKGQYPHCANYYSAAFLLDMGAAYAAADLVVSRAGMGSLSELSALAKPAVIIPIPHSHQEANALVVEKLQAGIILHQSELTSHRFAALLLGFFEEKAMAEKLSKNITQLMPRHASLGVAKIIEQVAGLDTRLPTSLLVKRQKK